MDREIRSAILKKFYSSSTFKKDKYESHLLCKSLDLRAQNKVLDSKIAII